MEDKVNLKICSLSSDAIAIILAIVAAFAVFA